MTTTDQPHTTRLRPCVCGCAAEIPFYKSFGDECWAILPAALRAATHTTNPADLRAAVTAASAYLAAFRQGLIRADVDTFVNLVTVAARLQEVGVTLAAQQLALNGSRATAYDLAAVVDAAATAAGLPTDAPTSTIAAAVTALADRAAAAEAAATRAAADHAELLRKHLVVAELLERRSDEVRELRGRRTSGGAPPPVTTEWGNQREVPPPATASDEKLALPARYAGGATDV